MSNKPPIVVPQGAIRLNTDTQKLEFYVDNRWYEMATHNTNLGRETDRGAGGRGIFSGGRSNNTIQFITISSAGDASNFGDASINTEGAAAASRTRYLGAANLNYVNTIDFVIFATTGDAVNFGDLTNNKRTFSSCSNSTRGVFMGGITPTSPNKTNVIDYVTIANEGNARDFGDLIVDSSNTSGNAGSSTRGLNFSGTPSSTDNIQYINIGSGGNSSTFGTLSFNDHGNRGASSNSIRAIHGHEDALDYVTIATLGDSIDFGDYLNDAAYRCGVASPTRVVFGGGSPGINTMGYVQIATQGDAVDFGDLVATAYVHVSQSNCHGGL